MNSGGAGFLGVRQLKGALEIRIEYDISHTINTLEPIQSNIIYEGPFPIDQSLIFFAPFKRKDNTKRVHVLVFNAVN